MKQAMSSPTTPQQMIEVVKAVKPGDKIEIVFANKTFNGDLKGLLYMFIGINGRSFEFGDLQMLNIRAVADTGKWCGMHTYIITALKGFNPEHFIDRAINRKMLESVKIV